MTQGTEYPPPAHLKKELVATVREVIGPIATPDVIHWAPGKLVHHQLHCSALEGDSQRSFPGQQAIG